MASRLSKDQYNDSVELLNYFVIDGKRGGEVVTAGQVELFGALVFEISDRMHIMTCTQYGKSLFVALACIVLSCFEGDVITVLAPTEEKANIIMRYYLHHIGDSKIFVQMLDKQTKIERLQMETTKDRIILQNKGGIFTLSAQGGNTKKGFEAAMGEGSSKVILDEAALTPDVQEATVFRMISGKGSAAMYVKIGNPFYKDPPNSHFWKSYRDPKYLKIDIDYRQALEEGRYSHSFIEEARQKPLFSVLYENQFPKAATQDDKNYIQLITEAQLDNAYLPGDIDLPLMGNKTMGVDIAGGGRNKSTIVVRGDNFARLVFDHTTPDPMILISEIEKAAKKYDITIDDDHVFPDKTGAIAFCARMNEVWGYKADGSPNNFGVTAGGKPEEDDDLTEFTLTKTGEKVSIYINVRAQISFRAANWIQRGGKLAGKPDFDESLHIRYKVQSDKKYKIKSKEDMADEGIESPDKWDAFALTFAKRPVPKQKRYKQGDVETMTGYGV